MKIRETIRSVRNPMNLVLPTCDYITNARAAYQGKKDVLLNNTSITVVIPFNFILFNLVALLQYCLI